jgi:hypothetical protein
MFSNPFGPTNNNAADSAKQRKQAQRRVQQMLGNQKTQAQFKTVQDLINPQRGARFVIGCIGGFIFLFGLFMFGIFYFTSVVVEETSSIEGDTTNYNPIEQFDQVSEIAGPNAQLTEITAKRVKFNGTLDLEAEYKPGPEVTFKFFQEVPAPEDAPPPGAIRNSDGQWYEKITITASKPGTWGHVTSNSGGVQSEYQYVNLGLKKDVSSPRNSKPGEEINTPQCQFKDFWNEAIKQGATPDAVSDITYDEDGYTFELNTQNTQLKLEFDQNCQLIKEEEDIPTKNESPTNAAKRILKEQGDLEKLEHLEEMEKRIEALK